MPKKPRRPLVTEIERLTRGDLAEAGRVLAAIKKAGVRLVTPAREFSFKDADEEFWYSLTAAFGRRELSKFKERVSLRFDQFLREGRHRNGCMPYGYLWDFQKKLPVPEPEEFPALQSWCQRILAESTHAIARDYGLRATRVRAVLRNPTICGYPVHRFAPDDPNNSKGPYHILPPADWTWPEQPGDYPAACTRPEWEAIQTALDRRMVSRSATWTTDGWCRRVLRFHVEPNVGDPIPGYPQLSQRYGNKPIYRFFVASGGSLEIARAVVHEIATEAMARLFADPVALAAAWTARMTGAPDDRAEELQSGLAYQRTLLDKIALAEATADNPEHQASLTRNRLGIQAEIKRLQRDLHAARVTPPPVTMPVEVFHAVGARFVPAWSAMPDSERMHLVEVCLSAIHLYVKHKPGRHQSERLCLGWDYALWTGMPPVRCQDMC